ncbi:MAG: 50S ribosomal protein L29 [Candidatus Neomarinimicrobiota bacterium]
MKINHLKKEIAQLKTIKREFDLGLRSGKDGQ